MSIETINHVFRSLEKHFTSAIPSGPQQPMPGSPALVERPEGSSPTAGIGTADAGSPITRYWTVRFRHDGSAIWNYAHVIACDPFKASMVVSNRDRSITEVVREIDREEYEHLTKVSHK